MVCLQISCSCFGLIQALIVAVVPGGEDGNEQSELTSSRVPACNGTILKPLDCSKFANEVLLHQEMQEVGEGLCYALHVEDNESLILTRNGSLFDSTRQVQVQLAGMSAQPLAVHALVRRCNSPVRDPLKHDCTAVTAAHEG